MKKKDEYNVKFYNSPFLMVGYIFMLILSYGLVMFIYILAVKIENVGQQFEERPIFHFVFIAIFIVFPTILFICVAHRGFTKIEVSERGVETSLFRIFRKRHLTWSEIEEITYFSWELGWIFLSTKAGEAYKKTYNQLIKNKHLMQIQLTKKVYKAITHYYDKPIIGLTEKQIKNLTKK